MNLTLYNQKRNFSFSNYEHIMQMYYTLLSKRKA